MDDQTIAIATLLTAVESVRITRLSLVLGCFSSFATLIIAVIALNTWKSQEKIKVKLNFKMAIARYFEILVYLPPNLNEKARLVNQERVNELVKSLVLCKTAWDMTENSLSKTTINDDWEFILDNHSRYLKGEIDITGVFEACQRIFNAKILYKWAILK